MTLFVIHFTLFVLLVTAPFLLVCCSRVNDRRVSYTRRRIYLEFHASYTTRVAEYDVNIKLNNIHFEEWLF